MPWSLKKGFKKEGRSGRDEFGAESKGLEPFKTEVEGLKPWGDKRETHVGEMQGLVGTMHTCKQEMQTDIHEMKGLQHSMESRVKELKTLTERAKTDPESLRKQFGSYERGLKEMQKQSAAFDKALKTQMVGIEDRARKRSEHVNSEVQRMHKRMAETQKNLEKVYEIK